MTQAPQIRPLEWRDLAHLHRLRRHGLCLDSQLSFTRGVTPLQTALLDTVTPGRGECTLVAPHASKRALTAIGQISHRHSAPVARLSFLGPASAIGHDNGLHLLEALAELVGRRGGQHLIADVDEDQRAFESLRRAGFAVYARQRVWQLDADSHAEIEATDELWRQERPADENATHRLYLNLVPALVQQIEPPPAGRFAGLVHWNQSDLHGYLDVERGARGIWVQPYFHPGAENHDKLLARAFQLLGQAGSQPLYICVRSYQGWMNAALERMGLARIADQAVMVKRLTAPIREAAESRLPTLESTRPEPSAPYLPTTHSTPAAGVEKNRP